MFFCFVCHRSVHYAQQCLCLWIAPSVLPSVYLNCIYLHVCLLVHAQYNSNLIGGVMVSRARFDSGIPWVLALGRSKQRL